MKDSSYNYSYDTGKQLLWHFLNVYVKDVWSHVEKNEMKLCMKVGLLVLPPAGNMRISAPADSQNQLLQGLLVAVIPDVRCWRSDFCTELKPSIVCFFLSQTFSKDQYFLNLLNFGRLHVSACRPDHICQWTDQWSQIYL